MAKPYIQMPSDPNSEIYYDGNALAIAFRPRSPKETGKKESTDKVLRVVVQCYGSVIEDRLFQPGTVITIGQGRSSTFRIPTQGLPPKHPLISYGQDGVIQLSVNQAFNGIIQSETSLEQLPVSDGKAPHIVKLKKGSKGCIQHGSVVFYFEEIENPEKVPPVAIIKTLTDPQVVRWWFLSLAIHFLIILIAFLIPPSPKEVMIEELKPKFQKIVVKPRKIKPYVQKMRVKSGASRGKVGKEGEGRRARGKEGRRGKGVPGKSKRMSRKDIGKTGVLDVFSKSRSGSALADLIGGGSAIPGAVDKKLGNRSARYGLPGAREFRSGKGLRGGGTGGGGLSTSLGQGLGTKGKGGGATGTGLADFGTGRSNTAVSASIDDEEMYIQGSIPKEVIAKIIADNIGKFKYCYDRQVQVQPNLGGKILTNFIIGLQGRVTSTRIKRSTMNSPPVERCVQNVLRRLRFPKPGGGIVDVTYPFHFRVAG